LVTKRLVEKTTDEWIPLLEQHKIWHAQVHDYQHLQSDPQLSHMNVFQTEPDASDEPITLVSHPARYDGQAPALRRMPQPLGAQSREILAEAGYSKLEIDDLIANGAIGAN